MTDKEKKTDKAPAEDREPPIPAGGPHARSELTNEGATPGAGELSETNEDDQNSVSS